MIPPRCFWMVLESLRKGQADCDLPTGVTSETLVDPSGRGSLGEPLVTQWLFPTEDRRLKGNSADPSTSRFASIRCLGAPKDLLSEAARGAGTPCAPSRAPLLPPSVELDALDTRSEEPEQSTRSGTARSPSASIASPPCRVWGKLFDIPDRETDDRAQNRSQIFRACSFAESPLRVIFPSEPRCSAAAKSLFASIPQASTRQPGPAIRRQAGSTESKCFR